MRTHKHIEAFEAFIESRLSTYGTMAMAVLASAAANPAQAAVIAWDPADLLTGPGGNIYFNMTTGAANTSTSAGMDFRLGHSTGFGSTLAAARVYGVSPNAGILSSSFSNAVKLQTSQSVGANGGFANQALLGNIRSITSSSSTFTTRGGQFGNGGRGFIGLKFEIANVAHFGWADISVDFSSMEITLHRFAYNDVAGQDIHVADPGAVPEPSSALLLAMGAAGLAAYRRKKKAA